jgi:hypothetical protein
MAAPVFQPSVRAASGRQFTGLVLEGAEELRAALAALGARAIGAAALALNEAAEEIMTEAKRRTPVDTGNLRASGHVAPPEIGVDGVVRETLGFGGPAGTGNRGETNAEAVGYAVPVHYDLAKRHPVGQALFLESAMLDAAGGLEAKLAESLRAELARGA